MTQRKDDPPGPKAPRSRLDLAVELAAYLLTTQPKLVPARPDGSDAAPAEPDTGPAIAPGPSEGPQPGQTSTPTTVEAAPAPHASPGAPAPLPGPRETDPAIGPPRAANASRTEAATLPQAGSDRTRAAQDAGPETVPTIDVAVKRTEGAVSASGETSSLPPAAADLEFVPDPADPPHPPREADPASARSSGSADPAPHSLVGPTVRALSRVEAKPATALPIAVSAEQSPSLERNGEAARADAASLAPPPESRARDNAQPGVPTSEAGRGEEAEIRDARLTGKPTERAEESRRSLPAEAKLSPPAAIAEPGPLPGPPTDPVPTPTPRSPVESNAAAEPISRQPKPSTTARTRTSEAPQPRMDGTVSPLSMAEPGAPPSRPPQATRSADGEMISARDATREPREVPPKLRGDHPSLPSPGSDTADIAGREDGPARKQTTEPEGPAEVPPVEVEPRDERDGVTAGGQESSDPVAWPVHEPQIAPLPDVAEPTGRVDTEEQKVEPDLHSSKETVAGNPVAPESSTAVDAPATEGKSAAPTGRRDDALAEMPSGDPEPRIEDDAMVGDPIGSDRIEDQGGPPQRALEPASAEGLAPAGETGPKTAPDQPRLVEAAVQGAVFPETTIPAGTSPAEVGPPERAVAAAEGPVEASTTKWGPPTDPDEATVTGDDHTEPPGSDAGIAPRTMSDPRRHGEDAAQNAALPDSVASANASAPGKEPVRLRAANAASPAAPPPAKPRGSAASNDATADDGSAEPAPAPRRGRRSDIAERHIPSEAQQGDVVPDPRLPTEMVSDDTVPPAGVAASAPSAEPKGSTDMRRASASDGGRRKPPTEPLPERQPTFGPEAMERPAPADRRSRETKLARRRPTGAGIRDVVSTESRRSPEAASMEDGSGRTQAADADDSAVTLPGTPDAETNRDRATTGREGSTETVAESRHKARPAAEPVIVDPGATRGVATAKAVPHRRQRVEPSVPKAVDVRRPNPSIDATPAPDASLPEKRDTADRRSQGNPRGPSRGDRKAGAELAVSGVSKAVEVASSTLTAEAAELAASAAEAWLPAPAKTFSPSPPEAEREAERPERGKALAEADGVPVPTDPPPGPKSDAGSPTIEEARPSAALAADAAAEGAGDPPSTAALVPILNDMALEPEAAGTAPALRRSPSRWDEPADAAASAGEDEVAEAGESALSTALRGIAVVVVAGGALTAGLLAIRPDAPEPAITVRAPRVIETRSVPLETGPAPRPLRVDLAKTLRDLDLDGRRSRFVRWVPEAPADVCQSLEAAGWASQDWAESPLGEMSECLAERTFGDGKGASGFAVLRGRETLSEIRIKLNIEDAGPRRAAARETGALVAGLFDRWHWDGGAALGDRIAALEPFQDEMHGTSIRLMREHGDVERWNLVLRFPTPPPAYKASPEELALAAARTGGTFKPSSQR